MSTAGAKTVNLDAVESELRKMWQTAGPDKKGVTRVQTTNVVALCETPAHASVAEPALASASSIHGARTLLVSWRDGDKPGIRTDVALHPSKRPNIPAGEAIWIEASGKAREWVPDTVGRLLTADLPVYVWWVGDLPDDDPLFDRVAAVANLAIFNSNDMDMRDLPVLDRMAKKGPGGAHLADFCWHRLHTWQELVARFFDDPRAQDDLSRLDEVLIRFNPRKAREPEPVSNQASLFAGWLAHKLGFRLVSWTKSDLKTSVAKMSRAQGGELTLRFEAHPHASAPEGAIVDVKLTGKGVSFEVSRDDADAQVICWSATHPTVPFPQQCLRIGIPDEGKMLTRVLERPVRDPLFEQSLHEAATLIAEIAPRASKAQAS